MIIKSDYKPQVYLNGTSIFNHTGTATAPNAPTISTSLGTALIWSNDRIFLGSIGMGAIYNSVLSGTEVTNLYNAHHR